MESPAQAFERVYVVNLNRRPDRWADFARQLPRDWPWPAPVRVAAVDGKQVPHPAYWRAGGGAWGCFRTHLALIEQCLSDGVRSVLLLEDDAVFVDDFCRRALEWLRLVPADWEMLYLGGQHLKAKRHPPIEISPGVYQPYNVNRTHAWALQGHGLRAVYSHLVAPGWHPKHHIDHRLGVLHQERQLKIYTPAAWLVGQAGGRSNISGRQFAETRYWPPAAGIARHRPPAAAQPVVDFAGITPPSPPMANPTTFAALIGTHSSGSTALAAALQVCGLWFGPPDLLTGYWGKTEHRDLARICEAAWPFRSTQTAKPGRWIRRRLGALIRTLRAEAASQTPTRVPAAKYPQLCLAGPQLQMICGESLRLIVCDRDLDTAVASIWRRTKTMDPAAQAALRGHQAWLAEHRDSFAKQLGPRAIRVKYEDLLAAPGETIAGVCRWLGLCPTPDQLAAAVGSIARRARGVSPAGCPASPEREPRGLPGEPGA